MYVEYASILKMEIWHNFTEISCETELTTMFTFLLIFVILCIIVLCIKSKTSNLHRRHGNEL